MAKAYEETKRRDRSTLRVCEESDLIFQPVVFETLGGCDVETAALLSNLYQEIDRVSGCRQGRLKRYLQTRISVDLQRTMHQLLMRSRRGQVEPSGHHEVAQGCSRLLSLLRPRQVFA